jgi:hypothetical protein
VEAAVAAAASWCVCVRAHMCVRACACMVCGPVRVGEGGKRAAVAAVMANSAGWDRGMGRHFRLVAIDNAEDEDDVADEGVDDMERPHPSPPAIHTPDPALQVRRRLQCIPATIQRPATVGGAAPLLCIRPGSGFAAAATDVRIVCSRTFGQCGSRLLAHITAGSRPSLCTFEIQTEAPIDLAVNLRHKGVGPLAVCDANGTNPPRLTH